MSNIDRAARLLIPNPRWCEAHHKGEVGEPPCMYCEADADAGAARLADAGLLAPDLPEPQEHGGKPVWPLPDPDDWAVSLHDGWMQLSDERGVIFTASTKLARDLGHIFLAASNHAEEGNNE